MGVLTPIKFGVTIVIPVHDKELYLAECLESVLSQTFSPIEVIIIDDASTDKSVSIARSYEKRFPFVRLLRNESNQGVSNSRNRGAESATFDYLCFLDADDFFVSKHALEDMMHLVSERACAYGRFVLTDKNGAICKTPATKAKGFKANGASIARIIGERKQTTFPRNYVVPKMRFFDLGGFDFPFNYNEDIDLIAKLLADGVPFVPTNTIVSAYRLTGNGLSTTNSDLRKKANRLIKQKFWPKLSFLNKGAYQIYRAQKALKSSFFSAKAWLRNRLVGKNRHRRK